MCTPYWLVQSQMFLEALYTPESISETCRQNLVRYLRNTIWTFPVSCRDGAKWRIQTKNMIASITAFTYQQFTFHISSATFFTTVALNVSHLHTITLHDYMNLTHICDCPSENQPGSHFQFCHFGAFITCWVRHTDFNLQVEQTSLYYC